VNTATEQAVVIGQRPAPEAGSLREVRRKLTYNQVHIGETLRYGDWRLYRKHSSRNRTQTYENWVVMNRRTWSRVQFNGNGREVIAAIVNHIQEQEQTS
jgi:hypothetical protein